MSDSTNLYNKYLRDKIVKEEQIIKIKEIGLDILKDFNDMCQKADIKYSLALKTLLGAVKYHKFLPGDDLVRVFVKEEDFPKLQEVVRKEYPSDYAIIDRSVDKIYTNPNPRLVKLNTLLVAPTGDNKPDAMGVFIDIYILRNAPIKNRLFKEARYKKYLQIAYQVCEFKYPSKILRERAEKYPQLKEYYNKRRSAGFFASLFPVKFWTWCRDKAIKGKVNCDEYLLAGERLRYIKKDVCNDFSECEFEGINCYVFTQYEKLFKMLYGDYLGIETQDLDKLKVLFQLEK